MIFRRCGRQDIARALPLMMRGLSIFTAGMRPSQERVIAIAERCVTDGYAALAEKDEPCAYIGALPAENPFFDGIQLCVVGWYSEQAGAGFALYRMMMAWADSIPMIRSVLITTNPDDRLRATMEKMGALTVPSYLIVKDQPCQF